MATSQNIHNPCTDQDSEEIEEKMVQLFQEHIKLSAEINELECQLDMKPLAPFFKRNHTHSRREKMSRYAVLIALLAAFIALSSCGDQIPTMPTSAGKVAVEEEPQSYIVWECGADEWTDAADSTWTIFFHGQFRLYLEGTTVEISEYISSSSKLVYEPGEPGRPGFTLYAYGSWCAATTELIGTEIPDIRIWRGDVDWLYRNDPQHSRYVLYENDLVYHIASIGEDDAVGYIDFESFHNRNNPRPMLETGSRGVWPVNVDEVKRDSLEVLGQVPTDDRPYLLDVVCQGAECPDFVQDIELQDQLVRGFEEKDVPQGPTATKDIVQGEEVPPASTTTIIHTKSVEFVSQEGTPEPPISTSSHASHNSHASHAPGHIGNSCGTGPMPANWPVGCETANWNDGPSVLNCTGYYRCAEYGPPSGDCVRWSGPYGRGGVGQTFCDKYGQEWATREDYSAAVSDGNVEGRSFPLEIYCASPVRWKNLCDSGDIGDCSLAWEDCDLDSNGNPFTLDTVPQCPTSDKGRPCWEPVGGRRKLQFDHMYSHCMILYSSAPYCGTLPYPEGWTGDWPPTGFTKQ